jgi:hypothetical protein
LNRFSTSGWATEPASEQEAARLPTTATARGVLKWLFRRDRQTTKPQAQEAEAHLPAPLLASRPLVGNRYVLLEELGRSGMAIVYLAWNNRSAAGRCNQNAPTWGALGTSADRRSETRGSTSNRADPSRNRPAVQLRALGFDCRPVHHHGVCVVDIRGSVDGRSRPAAIWTRPSGVSCNCTRRGGSTRKLQPIWTRGRPPFGRGGEAGRSGSMRFHSASGNSTGGHRPPTLVRSGGGSLAARGEKHFSHADVHDAESRDGAMLER